MRDAVPAGLFAGKSKQLYDCLYALTRGAVVPTRSIRISRPKLMKRARIGARVTFDANVERLVAVGLIEVKTIAGEHDGNEYTIRTPDEISMPSQTTMTSQTRYAQKLVRLVRLETSQTRHTSSPEESTTYDTPKTSFKTDEEIDDDEAFGPLARTLKTAAREVTGKDTSAADAARWQELAQLLATELKLAAARTHVSSAPAFLTEHLRRRLWKKEKRELDRELKEAAREASASVVDATECPDCRGTGLWYPAGNSAEGLSKGVARCRHEKLSNAAKETTPEP
ncbi:MAG TPA: hypothetical protein VNA19_00180 [Pyrinomonadaceae bacterium]|nr:hypothetical protein [Pyrinomonadaceae bacterium]